MLNVTLDALLQFMRKNKYEAEIQPETDQVFTIFKINQKEYPLFLRIFDEGDLLQLLVFIPSYLEANPELGTGKEEDAILKESPESERKKSILAELARLLHLLNKELDVPGFGMDETAGVVFYRIMLPIPKKKIDSELLIAYVKTIEQVCPMFSPPIEAITSGQMTLNQILLKAKEMEES